MTIIINIIFLKFLGHLWNLLDKQFETFVVLYSGGNTCSQSIFKGFKYSKLPTYLLISNDVMLFPVYVLHFINYMFFYKCNFIVPYII